jgi:hypothetical protein
VYLRATQGTIERILKRTLGGYEMSGFGLMLVGSSEIAVDEAVKLLRKHQATKLTEYPLVRETEEADGKPADGEKRTPEATAK